MKIIMGIVFWGVFCCAPLFVHGDDNTNPPVAIAPAPDPASVISLRAFIDDYLSRSRSGSDKKEIELYADQADYFGEGMQSRSYISNDIDKYNSRWPQRHIDINGLPTLKQLYGDTYYVAFDLKYFVTNGVKSLEGTVLNEMNLTKINGEWKITLIRQTRKKAPATTASQSATSVSAQQTTEFGDPVDAPSTSGTAASSLPTDAVGQFNLGEAYANVVKDPAQAVRWYLKSAELGYALAQFNLGVCYSFGRGIPKDESEAVIWYRKAADQGIAVAQYNLGLCYDSGIGVNEDKPEAVKWYAKAAKQGNPYAQINLGLLYCKGIGVVKNELEGLAWFYVAAAEGNQDAANHLSYYERLYGSELAIAARNRATEIQAQIATPSASGSDSSTFSTQPNPTGNNVKATGSGAFLTTDGYVLTAAHVVQGATRLEIATAIGTLSATVVKVDASNDVALLKCTGNNFTPLPIAPSKNAREGATVFTIGFPNIQLQGFDPKLTKGEISSETGFQDDPRQWQISVPTQPGNSGGPLCDENGNLIGMVEATLNPLTMAKVEGEIPQNVNYAVKSSYILPLLDNVQNLPPPVVPSSGTKFEDIVGNVQKSAVLTLVY